MDATTHDPPIGSERTVRRFAWLPVFVDDGYGVVWLRRYLAHQRYAEADAEPWGSVSPAWVTIEAFRDDA